MSLTIVAKPLPLEINADNVVLVGKTRVTLDTVIGTFNRGTTAEEIVYRYPSLKLADVYATIAFYLDHQRAVDNYLENRRQQAETVQEMNESRPDAQNIRHRLLARKRDQATS
ncbi:MAG: DUF433 domain-containing protein [Phormidesmis sp.]